jgi:pimeloyl-ACP methyl ester carboxylesterase
VGDRSAGSTRDARRRRRRIPWPRAIRHRGPDPTIEQGATVLGRGTRALRVGQAPTFVLLHGWTDSADCWRPLLRLLHQQGHGAVAYDLPGFGVADPVRRGPVFPQLDRFVAEVVRRASNGSGRKIVLVGNSLGGCLALRAAQDPDLPLAGVVPIGPAGPTIAPWLRGAAAVPGRLERLVAGDRLYGLTGARALGLIYGRIAQAGRPDPEHTKRYAGHNGNGALFVERIRMARDIYPEILDAWDCDLIDVPVRVIWGERDRLCLVRGAEPLAGAVRDGTAVVLPGVGHLPQLEVPDTVLSVLLDLAPPANAAASTVAAGADTGWAPAV